MKGESSANQFRKGVPQLINVQETGVVAYQHLLFIVLLHTSREVPNKYK